MKASFNINQDLFIYKHCKEITKYLKPFMNKAYYNGCDLITHPSQYLMAFGEKSNGKSTFYQMVACIIWWLYGAQSVLMRLYDEDFKKGRAEAMFGGLPQGFISKLTNDAYDNVTYRNFKWYFSKYDLEKNQLTLQEIPFCHRQCILNAGSSFQYPLVELIIFDEFIRKDTLRNVPDEFIEFQTVVSTIKRNKTTLQIAMIGNSFTYNSTYFREMGISNIRQQLKGTIDTYRYGNNTLSVSCEYCDTPVKDSKGNDYFAFNNPKLEMIYNGKFQLDIYPHIKRKYKPKDVVLTYYIKHIDHMLQCDIINTGEDEYTYVHDDLTNTVDYLSDLIYQINDDTRMNVRKNILKPTYDFEREITKFYLMNKVFYKSNDIGDIAHDYIATCKSLIIR